MTSGAIFWQTVRKPSRVRCADRLRSLAMNAVVRTAHSTGYILGRLQFALPSDQPSSGPFPLVVDNPCQQGTRARCKSQGKLRTPAGCHWQLVASAFWGPLRKSMIKTDQGFQATLERIRHLQMQLAHLRKTETNATNYRWSASGFLLEIDRMQLEVREYLSSLPVQIASSG